MIGQNPKAEVAPFFVGGNRDKEISFEDRCRREQMGWILCQTPGEEAEPGFSGQ